MHYALVATLVMLHRVHYHSWADVLDAIAALDFLALEGVADFLEHGVDGSFGRAGSLMKPPSARHRRPCHNTPP